MEQPPTLTSFRYRTGAAYDFDQPNESRADQAEAMLAIGTDRNAEVAAPGYNDVRTDMSDAIANLVHLCYRAGLDWDEIEAHARHAHAGDLDDGPEAERDTERFPEEGTE